MSVNNMPENKDPNDRLVPPEPGNFVPAKPVDRRVRLTAGDFRVVAPNGTQKGSKFYVNDSSMVIEKRGKDAMGTEKWDRITSFPKPGPNSNNIEIEFALYWLLAGPDAE